MGLATFGLVRTAHEAAAPPWINESLPTPQRRRAISLVGGSWALALLVAAPAMALVLDHWGARAMFAALGLANVAAAVALALLLPARAAPADTAAPIGAAAVADTATTAADTQPSRGSVVATVARSRSWRSACT